MKTAQFPLAVMLFQGVVAIEVAFFRGGLLVQIRNHVSFFVGFYIRRGVHLSSMNWKSLRVIDWSLLLRTWCRTSWRNTKWGHMYDWALFFSIQLSLDWQRIRKCCKFFVEKRILSANAFLFFCKKHKTPETSSTPCSTASQLTPTAHKPESSQRYHVLFYFLILRGRWWPTDSDRPNLGILQKLIMKLIVWTLIDGRDPLERTQVQIRFFP